MLVSKLALVLAWALAPAAGPPPPLLLSPPLRIEGAGSAGVGAGVDAGVGAGVGAFLFGLLPSSPPRPPRLPCLGCGAGSGVCAG
eukprot:576890-Pyramimonas_sp.AAC.1